MNPYIRINGRYTAAVENEKAAVEFIWQHMSKEEVSEQESRRVRDDLTDWFRENPSSIKTHTVKVRAKNNTAIIIERVLRG